MNVFVPAIISAQR